MTDRFPFNSSDGVGPDHLSADDRTAVVDALVEEMRELFHGYVRGEVQFEELSFEMFDTLQTLYAVTHGAMTIEYADDEGDPDGIDSPQHGSGNSPNGRHDNEHGQGRDGGQRKGNRHDRN